MKSATITIRIDEDLEELLEEIQVSSNKSRSEIVRESLKRQLRLMKFESLRKKIMPFAEARGYLTDEDIFAKIS